jgi:citrate synthase
MAREIKTPTRRLGDYYRSGDWSDYWKTAVSETYEGVLRFRGYPIGEIVEQLSYVDLLWLALKSELPTKAQSRTFGAVLTSLPDHQFISSHAPAARFVASAHSESPIPGIAAGLLCVGMHTISPQEAADEIADAWDMMQTEGLTVKETAKRVVDRHVENKTYIPGFGHPTHKQFDPRGVALEKIARETGVWGEKAGLYEAIHEEFVRRTGRNLPINIDGIIACVLTELDFDPIEMAGIALTAILPGVIAHVIEEIKDGVPLRIIPDELGSRYIGHPERHIPENRE